MKIMEFDSNIAKLHGTICSLGVQRMLNNPGSLHDVVAALEKIIWTLPDIDKSKMIFFMVLNTKFSLSEELKNDEFVGVFTNITPYIEKEYLVTYIYHLNLQLQLFGVIENCPGDLGLELLDVIIKKLKEPDFHMNEFGIEHLYQLWQSVFIKICKIDRGIHVNYCLEKFLSSFQDIFCLIQKTLLTSMKVEGLEVFIGCHLHNFFKTLLFCLKTSKLPNLPENSIYKFSKSVNNSKCSIANPINVCIKMIFDEIFNIMENVTVDMWMTLSQYYCDSNSKESVQMVIGDLVYTILQEVKEFDLPVKVLYCLSNFAINKSDVFAKAGIDDIVSNIESNERTWFEALLNHSGFFEKKSVECLISHLHLASAKDLTVILNRSFEYLCSCEYGENVDLIKELFLAAIKKTPDYLKWLEKVFETFRPNLLMTTHTNDELINAFNKMSKEKNVPEQDLISLCMQSPFDTIKRICLIAVSGAQIEFVIEILRPLKRPCSVQLSDGFTLLDSILLNFLEEELSERETQSFIDLIVHLGRQHFLGPLFFNHLLRGLKKYLESETLEKTVLSLKITKFVLDAEIFVDVDKPAFLVFMCQVLEHLTWDLKSFSNAKVEGRDLAVRIVALTMRRLDIEQNGPDLQWARKEILKSWEGNQAHFCGLWLRHNWIGSGKFTSFILALGHSRRMSDDFVKFLDGVDRPSHIRTSVVLCLFTLLPVLSFGEWNLIFDRLIVGLKNVNSERSLADLHQDVLDLFVSSLILLTLNLKREDSIYPCYKYCLRNFMRLAKRCCLEMKEESLVRILERIIQFLKMIDNKEKRKSCLEICSPVFVEVINTLKAQNALVAHAKQIEDFLRPMELKDEAQAVLRSLR